MLHLLKYSGTLRAILWEACDHDINKVHVACNKILKPYNINENNSNENSNIDNINENDNIDSNIIDNDIDNGNNENYNDDNKNDDNNTDSNSGKESYIPMISFEEYSLSLQGVPLKQAYEDSKNALQQNKQRQKHITIELNKLKILIDSLEVQELEQQNQQDKISLLLSEKNIDNNTFNNNCDNNEENDNDDTNIINSNNNDNNKSNKYINNNSNTEQGIDNERIKKIEKIKIKQSIINIKINNTKKDYRLTLKELNLCKEQINETKNLKKRALTSLLSGFETIGKN